MDINIHMAYSLSTHKHQSEEISCQFFWPPRLIHITPMRKTRVWVTHAYPSRLYSLHMVETGENRYSKWMLCRSVYHHWRARARSCGACRLKTKNTHRHLRIHAQTPFTRRHNPQNQTQGKEYHFVRSLAPTARTSTPYRNTRHHSYLLLTL